MNKTRTKPSFIKAAKDDYTNLKEEILDLHDRISNQDILETEFSDVKKEFENIKKSVSNVNDDIITEIVNARGIHNNLSDRLKEMDAYEILRKFETLNTTKEYVYDDQNRITSVIIRGDMNYNITYKYDADSNIVREERHDSEGNLIGYKDYEFDKIGQIVKESGENTDDVMTATTSIITDELNKRLTDIETIDFVKFAKDMSSYDVSNLWALLQDISSRLQHLETYLPDNQGNLIEIPTVLERIKELENRFDNNYNIYSFNVNSDNLIYHIPENIKSNTSIYLEGLLLTLGEDYVIKDSDITFLIPLIDDFTITCKY